MATLSDLVTAISGATGLPEATVFAYGRFARQAGFISQKGRGRSAASMSLGDATNLLIAVGATGVTREAGMAIERFRRLKGGRVYDFSAGRATTAMLNWLSPLGIRAGDQGEMAFNLKADFGKSLEFLISETLNGQLAAIFQRIPVAEIPGDLWREWQRERSEHLHQDMDLLIRKGLIKPKAPSELEFGEDISLELKMSRLFPVVEIEFLRMWDSPQVAFAITFGPTRGALGRRPHDMRLVATMTQHTLAAVALVLSDMVRASAIKSYKPMDALFAQQFRRAATRPPETVRDAKSG